MEKDLSSYTILVVEDNPADLMVIEKRVMSLWPNAKVIGVGSLEEAQEHYANQNLDMVLLDLNLPDSRGSDTVKAVREHVRKVPIVVVTGDEHQLVWDQSLKNGADEVIAKTSVTEVEFQDSLIQKVRKKAES